MTRETEERREYYRIEDYVALEILPGDTSCPAPPPLFDLIGELHLLDVEAQPLLRQIGDRDRALASYLKLQGKRLELLGRALTQSLLDSFGPPRQVVISEGGLRFCDRQPQTVGDSLTLRLLLQPEVIGLQLRARVLHCEAEPEGGFDIATEFEHPDETQRQLLARHILHKQALERRLAREARDEA